MPLDDYRTRLERDRIVAPVVGITVVAIVLRLIDVGGRNAHFDEGRVA